MNPTARRPQRLHECLQSLAAQTHREFELVLVDMSEGSMTSIVAEMRARLPVVRHLRLEVCVLASGGVKSRDRIGQRPVHHYSGR